MNPHPLHSAAEHGDIALMERILGRGMMTLDEPDAEGKTALHAAALAGQTNAVAWLAEHGGRIDMFTAAALGNIERVQSFLESDAKPLRATGPGGITPLHWATKSVAQLLLDRGADVNAKSKLGLTPLHEAARRNRKEVVALLLGRGADIDAADKSRSTPLNLAAERGFAEIVDLLLAEGARLDIFSAAALGRLDDVERALKADPVLLKSTDARNGQTLLHWAAMQGRAALVQRLLNLGADARAKDRSGSESIHLAARNSQKETVELLLQAGADVNSHNGTGSTCLHLAAEAGDADLARFLLDHDASIDARANGELTPLHAAAARPTAAVVELLLARGADINALSLFGSTPLHRAAQDGRTATVRVLLDHGADANIRTERQQTPFHVVIERRRWETATVFMEKGVSFRGLDGQAYSPLAFALQNDVPRDFVESLLDHYPNVNDPDESGRCPIQTVAQVDRADLLDLLFSRGADVNSRNDHRGRTALHWAAESGQMKMAEALLARNPDINATDRDHKTPLHLAAQRGRTVMVQFLLAHGAEVNAHKYVFEPTPLSLAVEAEHDDVAELLRQNGGRQSWTVIRMLLSWVAICAVLGVAHLIWQKSGRKLPPPTGENA